ncbi:MAG: sugar phosphate isomerase/epimerase [Clostridia bacterium]|nr:sugar phosphate isomerase/epimerase [Clostridia bacterium]
MKTYEIAVSTCGRAIAPEEFEVYAKAGVNAMELCFRWDKYDDVDWVALKEGADKAGIQIRSIHLPFSGEDNPAHMDEAVRKKAIARYKDIMKKASVTGATVYVIHASSEPIADGERAQQMENAKKTLSELAEFAKTLSACIAVEDLPRTCLGRDSAEIKELISGHDNLFVCFDTNHLLAEKMEDFIKEVGDRFVTLHVSDYDFIDEKHWLPGMGDVDWISFMDALDETDYSGPILFELYRVKGADTRPVTPEEFVQCAKELMARKPLTGPEV